MASHASVRMCASSLLKNSSGAAPGLGQIDAINRSGIAGGDVEAAGGIECLIPDVARLRAWCCLGVAGRRVGLGSVEDDGSIGFIELCRCVRVEFVNFAAWDRRGVERAVGTEAQRLNA
ncbi:MAG: hypothetical protein WDM87_11880 [Terracidiphilus sp.]